MTDAQWTITVLYSVATIIAVTMMLVVFRSTRVGFTVRAATRETIEKREGYWGVAVVALLVVTLGGTIFAIPYGSDQSSAGVKQRVKITGRQFAWTIQPARVRVGQKTAIRLDAADVNHAMGIFDPRNRLIKQVNVAPGVSQAVTVTFDDPGRYTIRCLEFCGVDHHLMENGLEVVR